MPKINVRLGIELRTDCLSSKLISVQRRVQKSCPRHYFEANGQNRAYRIKMDWG